MKTMLTVEIEYDPQKTDPEGLACAMDRLLETALSTPDILDEYGNPTIRKFSVAKTDSDRTVTRRWVLYFIDTNMLLTTRTYDSYDEAVEDASHVDDILVLPLEVEELRV